MKERLLIATLGTSPAVVTEAIDLLSEQGQRPDRVCIIKTKDSYVSECYKLLSEHIPFYYGTAIKLETPIEFQIYTDIASNDGAIEFMRRACFTLKTYQNNYECYVCIAGGRKVMSALLALAVKSYGAKRLFHIWAPEGIEREIREFRSCPLEYKNDWLHYKSDDLDRPRIVDLPLSDV